MFDRNVTISLAVGMGFKKITLLAYLLITSHIFAWKPSGWVYQMGDYQYEFESGDWYWKMDWDYWNVNLLTEEWTNSSANGWNYYTWPYFYSTYLGQWRFASDPGSGADIVNLSTSSWSKFGQEISGVPFAAIAESGEVKWWEYEVSAPISFSTGGDSYTVYTSGPIRIEHNENTNIHSIDLAGSFNATFAPRILFGNIYQIEPVSGNFDINITHNMSKTEARLLLNSGNIDIDINTNDTGTRVSETAYGTVNFSYSYPISASLFPTFRNDLWDLAVGYSENLAITISVDGKFSAYASSYGSNVENFSNSVAGTVSWNILAKHDKYTFDNITFSKVIQVRQIGYLAIPNSQEITSIEADLWLAENIGIIEINYISGMITSNSLKLKSSSSLKLKRSSEL